MKAGTAIPLLMPREEPNDLRGQVAILVRVRAGFPSAPRVEPTRRDSIAAAERGDVVAFVLRDEMVDEGEPLALRAAQNRMAFFKRSCSSSSAAYLRSRACNCAISRAGLGGSAVLARPFNRPSFTSFRHFDNMNG
jgi:hypothetical protein